jgi:hypothetical protein
VPTDPELPVTEIDLIELEIPTDSKTPEAATGSKDGSADPA